jgi:probable F420-dependent oxidoreductase
MKVGMVLPEAGQQATKENIVQAAKQAEEERFDSLWVLERLLCPVNPQTPYPNTPDGSFPIEFQNVLDTLETLTFVAANTNRITLGTSVIDMLFHNPVVLARRFATLDILSEGRAVAGFGIGWLKDEYQASNILSSDRGKRADEYIQLIKKIWTDDIVEFKGKYYSIPASKIGPKPFQKPHPPVYMGASSPGAFRRMVKYTNGWIGMIYGSLENFENTINMIKDMANQEKEKDKEQKGANNNGSEFKLVLLTYPKVIEQRKQDLSKKEDQRPPMTGTIDEIGSDLKKIKDMGVEHVIFGYSFGPIGRDVDKMIDITKQLSKFC